MLVNYVRTYVLTFYFDGLFSSSSVKQFVSDKDEKRN